MNEEKINHERENIRSALFEILDHQYGPNVIHPYTVMAIEDLYENLSELTNLREENEKMLKGVKELKEWFETGYDASKYEDSETVFEIFKVGVIRSNRILSSLKGEDK